MKYNFDEIVDRRGTSCLKYDFGMKRKGRSDLLPMWVADMDFKLPDEILEDLHKRIDHGIFGPDHIPLPHGGIAQTPETLQLNRTLSHRKPPCACLQQQ